MDNLNDNIDKQFLSNRLEKFGDWQQLNIDYHPVSKKHLGLARIIFRTVRGAKNCVTGLHGAGELQSQATDVTTPIIDQITAQQIAGSAMFGTIENMRSNDMHNVSTSSY